MLGNILIGVLVAALIPILYLGYVFISNSDYEKKQREFYGD